MSVPARLAFWAKEAVMRRGTIALMPETMAHQCLSRQEIDRRAWRRLGEVVRWASTNVPHYQRLWGDYDIEATLASPEAFTTLPTTTRVELHASDEGVAAPNARGRLWQASSSGTTGNKMAFMSDVRRSGWSAAARIRARRWWGIEPGDRTVSLYGILFMPGETLVRKLKLWRLLASNRLCGRTRISAYDMSADDMCRHVTALQRMNPRLFMGYGQSLVRLAEFIQREGIELELPRLQAMVYFSEPVTEAGRQTLTQVFGAPVASDYVCMEFGMVAHECPSGNMHISDDNLYVEVIDAQGKPVVGEIGEIVISDLRASRTPLLRYRVGDLGELAPADYVCPCGCTQRVLNRLGGRAHSAILLRDGGTIPPYALDKPLNVIEGAHHWQAHIAGVGTPHASLCYEIETTPEKLAPLRDRITAWLDERLNHEYAVTVATVDHIEPSLSGKYVQIIFED